MSRFDGVPGDLMGRVYRVWDRGRGADTPHVTRTLSCPMSRPVIERRLTEVGERLQRLRADLAVAEEQLAHLTAHAEDARVRSLVSETAQSGSVHRDAERHARAMERHRDDVMADIARLEAAQDELLDRMGADG